MDWKSVLQISLSLLGGSVAGTLLKMLYDRWQDRAQPVHYQIERDRLFSQRKESTGLQAQVIITHDGQQVKCTNLSLARVGIANRTRHDYNTFAFGITLPEGHEIIKVDHSSSDRYHLLTPDVVPTPASPARTLDFTCCPFNRNDKYVATVYIHSIDKPIEVSQIEIGTAAPVRLSKIEPIEENRKVAGFWEWLGLSVGLSALGFFIMCIAVGLSVSLRILLANSAPQQQDIVIDGKQTTAAMEIARLQASVEWLEEEVVKLRKVAATDKPRSVAIEQKPANGEGLPKRPLSRPQD